MAIEKLSTNNLSINNIHRTPPPEDTPDEEQIDPMIPNLTFTSDPINSMAHWEEVGVENVGGWVYGKATWLNNKHQKHS